MSDDANSDAVDTDPEAPAFEVSQVAQLPPLAPFTEIPHPSPEVDVLAEPTDVPLAVSPTGTPLISPRVVPFALIGAGLAVVAQDIGSGGAWTIARVLWLVGKIIVVAITGASPGLRKNDAP